MLRPTSDPLAIRFVRLNNASGDGLASPSHTCSIAPPLVSGWKLDSILILSPNGILADGTTWERARYSIKSDSVIEVNECSVVLIH